MVFITSDDRISVLNLSVRSSNALFREHIRTIGDLLAYPTDNLIHIKNMGAKSVAEITEVVESLRQGINKSFRLIPTNPSNDKEKDLQLMDLVSSDSENKDVLPTERDRLIAKEMAAAFGDDDFAWLRDIFQAKQEHDSDNDAIYLFWVYKSPIIRNAIKATILNTIDSIPECRLSDIDSAVPSHIRGRLLKEILTEMEIEQLISIHDKDISRTYPSLSSYISSISKERTKEIVLARLNGMTLDEVGQRYELTRERVRQIIDKVFYRKPRLAEDKYIYLYENYDFSLEDFQLAFGERDYVYYYLETVASLSRGKRKPIIETLTDEQVPIYLRKQAEKAVYKEYVTINGVRIRKLRREIAEYVVRTKCRSLTKFVDFIELYKSQIQDLGLGDDPAFELDEGTYSNKLSTADYILWSQWQSFRYYFIPERDYEPLLSTLNLKQYQNTEFSTLKLFRD